LLTVLLLGAFGWSLTALNWDRWPLHPGGLASMVDFFKAAFTPDLSASLLGTGIKAAWTTTAYAVAGICLAVTLGLPLGVLASGVLARTRGGRVVEVGAFRALLGFLRSIDILNDVPEGPLRALRSSGASELKVLLYGRLPMALPDMLSYSFYRLECAIRAAAIMSFVGIAGLGMQISLSLDDLRYNEVWTLLFFLIGLILLVDLWSGWLRRSLTR